MNFMQTAQKSTGHVLPSPPQPQQDNNEPVARPPSSTSGTSEILSVKDLEASMQKKAGQGVPIQAQNFAQGPRIYGTGRLMNRIPNLMDQQVALQSQQKMLQQEQHLQQYPLHMGPPQQQQPPPQQPAQQQQQMPNANNGGPDDMFAFQNFLAQISKSGVQSQGHPMPAPPGANKPMPPPGAGRMWGPEEANMLANSAGTPPILKMIMQQQQQQFLQERAVLAAAVKARMSADQLRLSPNGKLEMSLGGIFSCLTTLKEFCFR